MCDFRNPPQFVENIKTSERLACHFKGNYQGQKPQEPGMYYILGSGSYYSYYDGRDWWQDRNGWGAPSKEYWLPDGVHPSFNKYKFVFNEDQRLPLDKYKATGLFF
jgi:hypothetical protein